MKRNLLSMSLMLASLFGAAQPLLAQEPAQVRAISASTSIPDPAVQIRAAATLLRNNDLMGLLRATVPPSQLQLLRQGYDEGRSQPISDEDRAEFEEAIAKFTAPDAVERLMQEIEPKLVEARPQAPGAIMMGLGAMQMALSSPDAELTEEQRAALRQAMPGLQRWLTSTDFLSSLSMRQALTLVTDAIRGTGLDSIDELRMLSLEEALAQAGSVLASAKQAVRIYGLDLDAIADTLAVEVLAIEGDTARVRTTITVFDAPISKEVELVLVEGRWYGKDAVKHFDFNIDHHSDS
ncbi:MAG: hypothetical protein KDI60_09165 [Xanthomonadales bacterium]|nr:hypothetical protein [Xanthomonadales bacterium]MCP5474379.1 hypothetical protein [Rhodanobacteraceae bacterium]